MASDPSNMVAQFLSGAGFGQSIQQNTGANLQNQQRAQAVQAGTLELAAKAQAAQREQQFSQDWQAYTRAPTRQALAALAGRHPEKLAEQQAAAAAMDAPARDSLINIHSQIYHAAQSGRSDLIAAQLGNLIAASKARGDDTSDAEALQADLQSKNPDALKHALAMSQAQLYRLDPSFAKTVVGEPYTLSPGEQRMDGNNQVVASVAPKAENEWIWDSEGGNWVRRPSGDATTGGGGQTSGGATGGPSTVAPRYTGPQIEAQATTAVPGIRVTSRMRPRAVQQGLYDAYQKYLAGTGPWAPIAAPPGHSGHQNDSGQDLARDFTPPKGMTLGQLHSTLSAQFPGAQVLNEGNHVHVGPAPGQSNTGVAASAQNSNPNIIHVRDPKQAQAPSGYRWKGANLEPIPGGPADTPAMDSATVSTMAAQYLAGDKSVLSGLGRGKQGAQDIRAVRSEIARQAQAGGLTGRDIAANIADFNGIVAGERTAGQRIAQVELAGQEFTRVAPLALQASSALPRAGWVPIARAQQMVQSGTNNPALRKFVTANEAVINTYARAVSPTGKPTVSGQEHARQLLSTAFDQTSYNAVISQMQREVDAARAAPRDVRQSLYGDVGGMGANRPTRTATGPNGQKLGLIGGKWVPIK